MMTKEELKQEAEKWLIKFLLCNDCKRKCHCIELNAYCEEQVLKAYIDSAEPREKRIAELIALINAERERQEKCDDVHLRTIAELEKENAELKERLKEHESIGNAQFWENVWSWKSKSEQLTKAKEIINIATEGIKYWGIVGGTERPFEKQAEKLFNLFLDRVEQFLNDSEVEK